jgi:dihydroxy-acid dehydratase
VREGDIISLDIPAKKLDLLVDAAELARRKAAWKPYFQPVESSFLNRYRRVVSSGVKGAVLDQ